MLALQTTAPNSFYPAGLASAEHKNEFVALNSVTYRSIESSMIEQYQDLVRAMKNSANTRQWVTLINPPFIPNEHYLAKIGLENHYLRVIHLTNTHSDSLRCVQHCLQNGKSSLVAIWVEDEAQLPTLLQDEARLGCKALIFTQQRMSGDHLKAPPQLELVF